MHPLHRLRHRSWPFWALGAAWLCANVPPIALSLLAVWLANARDFSHQQQLAQDIAAVISGSGDTVATQLVARAKALPEPVPAESAPVDLAWKPAPQLLEEALEFLPSALRAENRIPWIIEGREPAKAAPPHGPPRGHVV